MTSAASAVPLPLSSFRNRIVGHGSAAPDQLLANPRNWRVHPREQRDALATVLAQVGWVQEVIVNQRTGFVVDGHLRVALALEREEPEVPVKYVDLSEDEEALVLATIDPLSAMAGVDTEKLAELLADLPPSSAADVGELLARVRAEYDLPDPGASEDGPCAGPAAALYSMDVIVDEAFAWYRAAGFPYRRLTRHECMQEVNALCVSPREVLAHTHLCYQVADTYHPHRFHGRASEMRSPFECFQSDKGLRYALALQLKVGAAIGQGYIAVMTISGNVQGCANFRPGYAALMYRRYCPEGGRVLDISTGYGGRLLGARCSGTVGHYVGIDPSTQTHAANLRMADDLRFGDFLTLHQCPAEDVALEALGAASVDMAFTSPPYFAKERYADEDTQCWRRYESGEAWRDGFLLPMVRLQHGALRAGAINVINIADIKIKGREYPLVEWCLAAARSVGFELVERLALPLPVHRFGLGEAHVSEPVLVFRKP